jgi:hypothetical protein
MKVETVTDVRHSQIEAYFIAFCWTAELSCLERNEGLRFSTVTYPTILAEIYLKM